MEKEAQVAAAAPVVAVVVVQVETLEPADLVIVAAHMGATVDFTVEDEGVEALPDKLAVEQSA